jgi:hypothetical protein
MSETLKSALAYTVFGFLTLLGFLTINMLPATVSAADVAQDVAEVFEPGTSIDIDNLVRIEDEIYSVAYDDSVSTEVLGTQTVRKIGYGKSEMVTITTTPTGTYSSDALFSKHIKYPGIEVEHVASVAAWVLFDGNLAAVALADGDSFADVQLDGESILILAQ